jgi:hypothetical protein
LPKSTPEGTPSVLDPTLNKPLWNEATLPYNLRLADAVGPLALVYGKSSCRVESSIKTDDQLRILETLHQQFNVPKKAKYPPYPAQAVIRTEHTLSEVR